MFWGSLFLCLLFKFIYLFIFSSLHPTWGLNHDLKIKSHTL